jgi:hypothetical protein
MVIEFNLQHIMILRQQERQLYVEMEHIVLAKIGKELVHITGEWQFGYDNAILNSAYISAIFLLLVEGENYVNEYGTNPKLSLKDCKVQL